MKTIDVLIAYDSDSWIGAMYVNSKLLKGSETMHFTSDPPTMDKQGQEELTHLLISNGYMKRNEKVKVSVTAKKFDQAWYDTWWDKTDGSGEFPAHLSSVKF